MFKINNLQRVLEFWENFPIHDPTQPTKNAKNLYPSWPNAIQLNPTRGSIQPVDNFAWAHTSLSPNGILISSSV